MTRNDLEFNKFELNNIGDVCVKFDEQTEDPLIQPTGSIEDLEDKKFTNTGKVRFIFTT